MLRKGQKLFDCEIPIQIINKLAIILVKVRGRVLIEKIHFRPFFRLNSTQFTQPFSQKHIILGPLVFGILEMLLIVLRTDTSKLYTHSPGVLLAIACSANTASLKLDKEIAALPFPPFTSQHRND